MGRFPQCRVLGPEVEDLWLPIAANYKEVNVASELKDPRSFSTSIGNSWRPASHTRPAWEVTLLTICNRAQRSKMLCLRKKDGDQRILVALNFSGQDQALSSGLVKGEIILSTRMDREDEVDLIIHPAGK